MKIHQIVSESGIIKALAKSGGLGSAVGGIENVGNIAKSTINSIKNARAAAKPTADAVGAAKGAIGATDDAASWVTKGVAKAGKSVDDATDAAKAAAAKAQYAKAADLAAEMYGSQMMKLLYALDFVKEVTVYNYQAGKLDKNAPDYEEQLRTLRGKFITAVIAPKVTIWTANKLMLGKIASAVPWIIKKFPGNRSAELAAIVKQVGSKGLEAALLVGFSTEAGKQWLVDTFSVIITGVGAIPELASWLGSTAKATAQVATGNLPKGYDKSTSPDMTGIDPTDPMSILNKAGEMGGRVDPFKGTGRGGK